MVTCCSTIGLNKAMHYLMWLAVSILTIRIGLVASLATPIAIIFWNKSLSTGIGLLGI